jgi:hypothetical protein
MAVSLSNFHIIIIDAVIFKIQSIKKDLLILPIPNSGRTNENLKDTR